MHQPLEPTRNKLWNDRDLPFRVGLAGKGPDEQQTPQGIAIADYGIREFPTTLFIGRDGKVVQRIYLHQVEENSAFYFKLAESIAHAVNPAQFKRSDCWTIATDGYQQLPIR